MADVEDAFDDVSEDKMGDRDYRTLKTARFKDGFREGVSRGQNQSAQEGFDTGYEIAFAAVREAAVFKGVITVILHKIKDGKEEDCLKKTQVVQVLTNALGKVDELTQNVKQDFQLLCDSYYKRSDAFRIASSQQNQGQHSEEEIADLYVQLQKPYGIEALKQQLFTVLTDYGWEVGLLNKLIKGDV